MCPVKHLLHVSFKSLLIPGPMIHDWCRTSEKSVACAARGNEDSLPPGGGKPHVFSCHPRRNIRDDRAPNMLASAGNAIRTSEWTRICKAALCHRPRQKSQPTFSSRQTKSIRQRNTCQSQIAASVSQAWMATPPMVTKRHMSGNECLHQHQFVGADKWT
jgi:hypothetical protein